jgi:hypothetical protein
VAPSTSDDVQIDHVVALSNAWQTGAQALDVYQRELIATDPLNLLAVNGPTNQSKGDGDAATWLPPAKGYRCAYVARQVAVKTRYKLWVTPAERDAIARVLTDCPHRRCRSGLRGAPHPPAARRLPDHGSLADAEDAVQEAWLRWHARSERSVTSARG